MFGRKAVLPIELEENIPPTQYNCNMAEDMEQLTLNRCQIFKEVKENIKKAQLKQKQQYDKKHAIPLSFKVIKH